VLVATDPATKKAVTEKGRFVTIFRKEANGSWNAVQDMNNPEAPAK
jgi:ketosteroid isomerase-like protein